MLQKTKEWRFTYGSSQWTFTFPMPECFNEDEVLKFFSLGCHVQKNRCEGVLVEVMHKIEGTATWRPTEKSKRYTRTGNENRVRILRV